VNFFYWINVFSCTILKNFIFDCYVPLYTHATPAMLGNKEPKNEYNA